MVTRCFKVAKFIAEVIQVVAQRREAATGRTIAPIDLAPELGTRGAVLLTDITEVTSF